MGIDCDVVIVGGGPVGMVLAIELGRRGVRVVLFNERPGTSPWPQANATQARTMEHFRRLGLSERIRARGLPVDYPTDIAYFTRYTRHELARFALPSSRDARALIRSLGGSWSAAELPHRCSQMYIEEELLAELRRWPSVQLRHGWHVERFTEGPDSVEVHAEAVQAPDALPGGRALDNATADAAAHAPRGDTRGRLVVRGRWLVGCDGARSTIRRQLGIDYVGETGVVRDFMGGRMHALHFRCPDLYARMGQARAWMYWAFNAQQRAFMAAIDGRDEFVVHMQVPRGQDGSEDPVAAFQVAFGAHCPLEVLSESRWTAGHALVAERLQVGRVFLAGDSAHLFTPTGGLGYNTGVEDAVNLGWKLAMVARGLAPERLLETYEVERRPVALRNTHYARRFADSIGLYRPAPGLEDDSAEGRALRAEAGAYLEKHARAEFNIPGITFGARYDGSPVIAPVTQAPPPDAANHYESTSLPGGRAPHHWMADGRSLYDLFGFEFTLLDAEGDAIGARLLQEGLNRSSPVPCRVLPVGVREVRELWQTRYALIRPDQTVAWRGDRLPADLAALLAAVSGGEASLWRSVEA